MTQYLTFSLAGEEYAIGILDVREILEFSPLTRVPGAPEFVRGVMNLRGRVVPVVDLAVKLGLPATVPTKWSCIVIVDVEADGERTVMGLMTDAVSQVVDLPAERIEPPPSFGTRVRTEYLLGLGHAGKKFVLVLDIGRVLSSNEILETELAVEAASEMADEDTSPEDHEPTPATADVDS